MQEAIYDPILDALADHNPQTLGQLMSAVIDKQITFAQLTQAVMVLAGLGTLQAVQDEGNISKAKKYTDNLNAYLINKCRSSAEISYLASPVTGGGVTVSRFQQLFMLAISQGKKHPADWALFSWGILETQGQKILADGKILNTTEENLAELNAEALSFANKQLPILKALQIA
jgi:hypothetical protein